MSADPKTYYDKLIYNELHFKRKRGGKHDVGVEVDGIIPSAGEIRLLGNRHRQCQYYRIGVEVCHTQMTKDKADNFLACKEPLDSMWNCYTEGKYGQSIRDAPEVSKPYEKKLYNCLFREGTGMDLCMNHFSDMVRAVYRSPENELCDWH